MKVVDPRNSSDWELLLSFMSKEEKKAMMDAVAKDLFAEQPETPKGFKTHVDTFLDFLEHTLGIKNGVNPKLPSVSEGGSVVKENPLKEYIDIVKEKYLREWKDIETEKPLVDIPASPMKQNAVENKTTLPKREKISEFTCAGGSVTGYINFPPIPYFHNNDSSFSGNKYFVRIHPKTESIPTPVPENPDLKCIGYFVDAYIIANALGITSHPVFHAFKKIAYAGKRGGKGYKQDIQEAIDSLQRELELTK